MNGDKDITNKPEEQDDEIVTGETDTEDENEEVDTEEDSSDDEDSEKP